MGARFGTSHHEPLTAFQHPLLDYLPGQLQHKTWLALCGSHHQKKFIFKAAC
jgi:hypothetical protein